MHVFIEIPSGTQPISQLLLGKNFRKISGNFHLILNFRKIYNPTHDHFQSYTGGQRSKIIDKKILETVKYLSRNSAGGCENAFSCRWLRRSRRDRMDLVLGSYTPTRGVRTADGTGCKYLRTRIRRISCGRRWFVDPPNKHILGRRPSTDLKARVLFAGPTSNGSANVPVLSNLRTDPYLNTAVRYVRKPV